MVWFQFKESLSPLMEIQNLKGIILSSRVKTSLLYAVFVEKKFTERRPMKEKVAVSGSHGFLGHRLSERLVLSEALSRDGEIPEDTAFVFDCAAFGNLASQRIDAEEIYKANLMRVVKSLDNLPQGAGFIYVSSSSVARPKQNMYSLSKKSAEEYIRLMVEDKKLKAAIIRPYAITGVGEQAEHLIPTLIRSCLYGEKMPFVPWPSHDFIDVEDVVDAMLIIREMGKMAGEVYEIGRGVGYTNQEVLQIVERVTGKEANIELIDNMRAYDSTEWKADTYAIKELGWEPEKSLEQSIEEMVIDEKAKHYEELFKRQR